MADTLTINLSPEDAARLQRLADETGESLEALASRIVAEAADLSNGGELSEEQHAELRRRIANPGPLVSAERTSAILQKFGVER